MAISLRIPASRQRAESRRLQPRQLGMATGRSVDGSCDNRRGAIINFISGEKNLVGRGVPDLFGVLQNHQDPIVPRCMWFGFRRFRRQAAEQESGQTCLPLRTARRKFRYATRSSRVFVVLSAALKAARLAPNAARASIRATNWVAMSTFGVATDPCEFAKGDVGS
jgi:hypothetical protein